MTKPTASPLICQQLSKGCSDISFDNIRNRLGDTLFLEQSFIELQIENHEHVVDSSLLCVGSFKWTEWDDSKGVDVLMRPEIMRFDVVPVTCLSNARKVKESFNERL